nr:immunoglobulin heavy chain junction region [Macaca mulatta]
CAREVGHSNCDYW